MNETKRVWISYTKLVGDVSRLDELLVINPENFLCYSESFYANVLQPPFLYFAPIYRGKLIARFVATFAKVQ